MTLTSKLTADHPCVDVVTSWVHEEWGKDEPQSFFKTKSDLLDQPGCPTAMVAMIDGRSVGVVSFRRYSVSELDLIGLWLNILYVEESHRGQGIAATLIQEAIREAASFDSQLFVYTPVPALYEKFGWEPFRPANEKGSSVLVKEIKN